MPLASSPRRTAAWLCGLSVTAVGAGWLAVQRNKQAISFIDTTQAVRVEEQARYQCKVLPHYDVVVRNYYLPCSAQGTDRHASTPAWHTHYYRAMQQWWYGMFSNDRSHVALRVTPPVATNKATSSSSSTVCDVSAEHGDAMTQDCVRLVVNDTAGQEATRSASAAWPAGTQKYCALVIEPSNKEQRGTTSRDRSSSHIFRGLLDTATQQSLVKCDARGTATAQLNCVADTSTLAIPYTRVLLAAFLLLPDSVPPSLRVGMLGVGGGAMAGFLQHYFARVLRRLDLVDIEPMCLIAAVRDMGLSDLLAQRGSGEVRMYATEAAQFLRDQVALLSPSAPREPCLTTSPHDTTQLPMSFTPSGSSPIERHPFDVLLVDLFCGSRLAAEVTQRPFLQLCQAALAGHGVVAFNLPTADADFVRTCRSVFGDGNVLAVPVPRSANVVVLARNAWHTQLGQQRDAQPVRMPALTRHGVYRRSRQMQERYKLPYDLADHLPWWWRL